jgi:hypothetical protein
MMLRQKSRVLGLTMMELGVVFLIVSAGGTFHRIRLPPV